MQYALPKILLLDNCVNINYYILLFAKNLPNMLSIAISIWSI